MDFFNKIFFFKIRNGCGFKKKIQIPYIGEFLNTYFIFSTNVDYLKNICYLLAFIKKYYFHIPSNRGFFKKNVSEFPAVVDFSRFSGYYLFFFGLNKCRFFLITTWIGLCFFKFPAVMDLKKKNNIFSKFPTVVNFIKNIPSPGGFKIKYFFPNSHQSIIFKKLFFPNSQHSWFIYFFLLSLLSLFCLKLLVKGSKKNVSFIIFLNGQES